MPIASATIADATYAAGLFEGEGSTSIARLTGRSGAPQYQLVCAVQMGDPEPLEFLKSVWAGQLYSMPVKGNRRPQQQWRAYTRVAAAFLEDVLPYLKTERVRHKAERALVFQGQKANNGRKLAPEYAAAQEAFFFEMRRLNQRGLDAIPTEPRNAGARHTDGSVT